MNVVAKLGRTMDHTVSPLILGHNIETCITTVDGLLSDRLRNPKFVGPPHRMTGIAPEWYGASCGRIAYELTAAGGMMGTEAQLIRAGEASRGPALHQNRISILEGEDLELEIWARAWRKPVDLSIKLLPMPNRLESYDTHELTIDAPYYKRYTVPLHSPRTDDEARLWIDIVGTGELWFDQIHLRPVGEPLLCARLIEEARRMQIPSLRFPGGIATTTYNWKHGTGPVHLRPDMLDASFHQDWYMHYDFGTDEYLQLCADQGITPALTLNVGTGTPEEAAEWAAYCARWFAERSIDPPLIHWHIGNHPYHATMAHMTPDMYVDVLKQYVPAVTDNYPSCRIVAVMSRADLDVGPGEAPWRDAIWEKAADLVDVIEFQNYGGAGARPEPAGEYKGGLTEPDAMVRRVTEQLDTFETSTRKYIDLCEQRGLDINVGIAEWNWWMQASHWDGHDFEEPPLVLHGLFVAGMIHRFAELAPRFEAAHFYNLVNCMGILNHRDAEVEVTGVAEVFKLYRPALPGKYVEIDIESSGPGNAPPLGPGGAVEALALEQDGTLFVFLVNRHPTESARVRLENAGSAGDDIRYLRGDEPTGTYTVGSGRPAGTDTVDGLEVPPLTIMRCECSR